MYQATIFKVLFAPTYTRCVNEFQANKPRGYNEA
ncbi:hypothetical protein F383_24731 [Gossypium arboreum]|uniref:Uncharacterized protein n=1 Tax=Gossypium arboreum TaxID=29729 RepID=A0A0B0P8N2_GOSAR|nr:hypothetical protein F383_24731 [Gossypium arboreum]